MSSPPPTPISQFLASIRPWQHAYKHSTFTYVAVHSGGRFVVLRGRIALRTTPESTRKCRLESALFRADEIALTVTQPDALDALVSAIVSGNDFPIGRDHVGLWSASEGLAQHVRSDERIGHKARYVNRLTINGMSRWPVLSNLRAAHDQDLTPHGFASVEELLEDYGFKLSSTDSLCIEVVAEPVAQLDPHSTLSQRTARIRLRRAPGIATEAVTLTVVGSPSGDHRGRFRHTVPAADIHWDSIDACVGECTVKLPHDIVATCRVVVHNTLHDEGPLVDDRASANRRRGLVELADPQLVQLRAPLLNPRDNEERNQFEASIAPLLYMLGFEAVRIGGNKKLTAAADIFAMTPCGEVLIVECTTDVLDPHNKLQKLLRRVEHARKSLCEVWPDLTSNRVTGLILVPKAEAELTELVHTARRHGVIALCREQLEQALAQTQYAPDADAVLARWREQPLIDLMTKGLDAP